jgi:hypothetical protein
VQHQDTPPAGAGGAQHQDTPAEYSAGASFDADPDARFNGWIEDQMLASFRVAPLEEWRDEWLIAREDTHRTLGLNEFRSFPIENLQQGEMSLDILPIVQPTELQIYKFNPARHFTNISLKDTA